MVLLNDFELFEKGHSLCFTIQFLFVKIEDLGKK